jgi:hypothetical protein
MLVLPATFIKRGSIGTRRIGGIADSGGSIHRSGESMPGDMGRRQRLACSSGGRTGRIIIFDVTGRRVSRKRNSADIRHPEHARLYPPSEIFDGSPGPIIVRVSFLKIGQGTLGTVSRPDRQGPVVRSACQLVDGPVHARFCYSWSFHGLTFSVESTIGRGRTKNPCIPREKNPHRM